MKIQQEKCEHELLLLIPKQKELSKFRTLFADKAALITENAESMIIDYSKQTLDRFIANLSEYVDQVPYPGLLGIFSFANEILRHCNHQLDHEIRNNLIHDRTCSRFCGFY